VNGAPSPVHPYVKASEQKELFVDVRRKTISKAFLNIVVFHVSLINDKRII
jgi:hypothetical protein